MLENYLDLIEAQIPDLEVWNNLRQVDSMLKSIIKSVYYDLIMCV